jgi:hypothetical protein
MTDERSKKPATRSDSPTLDRLQAELSAGLKAGEDPLYYDWTRVAEAPPSEAAYVPPMQVQTRSMDTGDLAAVIGRTAAEAARHAPPPEHTVVIDEHGAGAEQGLEVGAFGDAIPTVQMHGGPVPHDELPVTRRRSAVRRAKSTWIWVASAVVASVGCAWFVWAQRGFDSGQAAAEPAPSTDLGAVLATARRPVPAGPSSAPATPTTRTAVSVEDLPAAAMTGPSGASPSKAGASVVQPPERLPSRRSPTSGSTARGRAPSTPQTAPMKPTSNEVGDPLLIENPGY